MKLNTTAITNAIIAALTHGDAFEAEMLKLHKLLKGADRDTIKGVVAPIVAVHYGETFADGQWADSKCAAKRKANRIIAAIAGTAPKTSSKVVVNKALVKQMTAMLKGMEAKVLNATIAAVKAALK